MNIPQKVIDICNFLEEKKAEDIIVCDTTKMHNVADFFVIATGNSSTHINGICDYLEEKARENNFPSLEREGFILSTWVVLDFDNVLVHLFTKEEREKYSLQKLLSDGKNEFSLKRINSTLEAERKKQEMLKKKKQEEEKRKNNELKKRQEREIKLNKNKEQSSINKRKNSEEIKSDNNERKLNAEKNPEQDEKKLATKKDKTAGVTDNKKMSFGTENMKKRAKK